MNSAALPVGIGPELSDRSDEPGCAIGHDQEWTRQATGGQATSQIEPVFGSFALTKTDIEQNPLAIERVAPGDQDALFGTFRAHGQVDRVEHQAQQADTGETLGPKRPIAVAELAADARHGDPADVTKTGLRCQALDVAVTEAANVGADDERFERSRPDRGAAVGDDRTDEAGQAVADLGHRDREWSLRGRDLAGAVAVAGAAGLRRALEAGSSQEPLDLFLDGPLEHELGAQSAELAQLLESVAIDSGFEPVEQEQLDLGLDLDTRGYPCLHGVVLLMRTS